MAKKQSYHEVWNWKRRLKSELKLGLNLPYRLYRLKWNLAGNKKIKFGFPVHIDLEATSNCNLKCEMCPQSFAPDKFKRGYMEMKLFKKIIDEGSKNGLKSIKLNWRGEPLLHPKIPEMIKYAKDKGIIEVMFNTNGQLLNPELSEKIIDAGLDKIIFSMDGATKETYEKIRKGASYEKLIKNIKDFVEIRNKKKKRKPFVRIQMVKMDETKKEVDKFIKMWDPIVDHIAVNDYSNRGEENERGVKTKWVSVGRRTCPQPFQRMMIAFDGSVMPCCFDWYGRLKMGDATKQSIKDIWTGEKLKKFKNMQLNNPDKMNDTPGCDECTLKISYEWEKK